jgi:CRISPR-associated endonuclease/helicase Cas3
MELISHDDRTLNEHLSGLKEVVDKITPEKTQTFFDIGEFRALLYNLISYHDVAKGSVYFQLYLSNALIHKGTGHTYYSIDELKSFVKENHSHFVEWQNNPELKSHALFGAWLSFFIWGEEIDYNLNPFLFFKILQSHHGYLKNFTLASINPESKLNLLTQTASGIDYENYETLLNKIDLPFKYGNIQALLDEFDVISFKKLERSLKSNKNPSFYFKTLFLYSILLSADKGDMMLKDKKLERQPVPGKIIDDFKKKNIQSDHSINELREKAYQVALSNISKCGDHNFFSITLPTGLGKTFTAYKSVLTLKEQYCPDFRIVYCLPFTSIIDQNAGIFKTILDHSGIDPNNIGIHHHLAVPDITEDSDDSFYSNWEYLTEGWHNEITITTFVQLWESLFACHNRQIRKFHNLANSIIILDEVQAINPELYPAFEFVMENMAKYFNTKFIFVTATQPVLLENKVRELCFESSEDFFFKKMHRTKLNKTHLNDNVLEGPDLSEIILDKYQKSPKSISILVICNTIRYSQNVFGQLKDNVDADNIYYLSAAIIPFSREIILEEIREKLSKNEPIILISTQVVEAGVDVDFDVVYRDFAPLSSINQAAGRCNRNAGKEPSNVYLFQSGKTRIYDPTHLDITQTVLNAFDDVIPENEFYKMNSQYFTSIKEKVQDGSPTSENLIRDILTLKFENIGSKPAYRLFQEDYKSYNYFIPIDEIAEKVWDQYQSLFEIEEHFKRKEQVKLFMPKVMKYVVKIPEYIHKPDFEDQDKAIVFDEYWPEFYDETFGYRTSTEETGVEII